MLLKCVNLVTIETGENELIAALCASFVAINSREDTDLI